MLILNATKTTPIGPERRRPRRAWAVLALLSLPVLALPLTAQPVGAGVTIPGVPHGWARSSDVPAGTPLAACVGAAEDQEAETWTCLGGQLTTTEVNAKGKRTTHRQNVVKDRVVMAPPPATRRAAAALPNYDNWCENGTVCGRYPVSNNKYIAEVKGNGAYGDIRGVIGAFDQVNRGWLNGSTVAWRAVLIWDSGPAINGSGWVIQCRKSDPFTDSYCGKNPWNPETIKPGHKRAWFPSSTGSVWNSENLTDNNPYHDDFKGKFTVTGFDQTWSSGTIHTGRWKGCNNDDCKYYQVPWTDNP